MPTEINTSKKPQISFRVEPGVAGKLAADAKKRGMNQSVFARMIIYEHYNSSDEGIKA